MSTWSQLKKRAKISHKEYCPGGHNFLLKTEGFKKKKRKKKKRQNLPKHVPSLCSKQRMSSSLDIQVILTVIKSQLN